MMGNENSKLKTTRILKMYSRLINGDIVKKKDTSAMYKVTQRTVQRDIDDIRSFLDDEMVSGSPSGNIYYDKKRRGYVMRSTNIARLSNSETLAVCKILLESRAFRKDELMPIIDKLLKCCVPTESYKQVKELISNEQYHYVEPCHNTKFVDKMWDLGSAVNDCLYVDLSYKKGNGTTVERRIMPVGIMFSEFYFYLTAYIDDGEVHKDFANPHDTYPTIYRIDRISDYKITDIKFTNPYKDRFEEGEFRKRVQFMYGGELKRIRFLFKGGNLEPVIDRLPTAKVVEKTDNGWIITAEVFGKGIDMWLKSQGDNVQVLE